MTLYVVTGPPCVGKSTWVLNRARTGDIVVDLDRIALAITGSETVHHDYPLHIRRAAITMRATLVPIAIRHSRSGSAFIIHAKPGPKARGIYRRHAAVWIELEAPMSVLLNRAAQERPPHVVDMLRTWHAEAETE